MEWIDPSISDWDKLADEIFVLAQSMDHLTNTINDIEIIIEDFKLKGI